MGKLESAVRTIDNLYRSWSVVRSNVNSSGQDRFKAEVKQISQNPIPFLRNIQTQLQRRRFVFEEQYGVLKTKSTGKKRPIVVSPIANRIVQRAILNVLQSENSRLAPYLGDIGVVLRTPTSVGGIPQRGVGYGIDLVRDAVKTGATHYLRSDIRDFFTRVPRPDVVDFINNQTGDDPFTSLFDQALTTELSNADEIKKFLYLFPLDTVGVPQGSSLSAFAGNLVLRDFDRKLNGRKITTIRYIDDFVILGASERTVRAAFSSAQRLLDRFGMAAYGPEEDKEKSKIGKISDGFTFLGCSIRNNGVTPSTKSKQNLLSDIKNTLCVGIQAVEAFASVEQSRRADDAYAQTLSSVDRKIRGWGDAFSFSDNRLPFHQIDKEINDLLKEFNGRANEAIRKASPDGKRRAVGVALLKDTPTPLLKDSQRFQQT